MKDSGMVNEAPLVLTENGMLLNVWDGTMCFVSEPMLWKRCIILKEQVVGDRRESFRWVDLFFQPTTNKDRPRRQQPWWDAIPFMLGP